jgi:hypothetical protein
VKGGSVSGSEIVCCGCSCGCGGCFEGMVFSVRTSSAAKA